MARVPRPNTAKAASRDKIAAAVSVVGKSSSFRPARTVLKRVRAVPTIFPHLDYMLKVGGWPIERLGLIHGPSHEGKTLLALGIGLSFLKRGHYFAYVDLERTTPITWVEKIFGPYADDERFLAARPEGNEYEKVVDDVRDLITNVAEKRAKKQAPPDTTVFVLIDSLRKLNPKRFMEKIAKRGADAGIDGMRGMGAATKAAMNAQWTDDLVPMLDDMMASLAFIGREYVNQEAANNPFVSEDYVVGGGKAVYFEASLSARITRRWVYGPGPEGEAKPVYGEQHLCRFKKSKVAGKEAKYIDTFFHSSNGAIVPAGFDRARDVVELARELEVVKPLDASGWLGWNRNRWHGVHAAVKMLTANPTKLEELEECCRARFEVEGGQQVDADGRVQT